MEKYLTLKETATLLGVHTITVTRWCNEGKMTYYLLGSRKRFLESDVLDFVKNSNSNVLKMN